MEKKKRNMTLYVIIIVLVSLIVSGINFSKDDKKIVTYISNNDGDTARFLIDGKDEKCRFIAIDTPEITTDEPYAKEARDYLEKLLTTARKIEIEGDPKADERDKFDRLLVWVYVDDKLVQDLIVKEGLAKVRYIYDDYMYVDQLNKSQKEAKKAHLGIWSNK